jgi:t-SNARE complex subunit (syntaxin)
MSSSFDDILKQQANLEKLLRPTAALEAQLKDWNTWKQIEDAAAIAQRITDPVTDFAKYSDALKISVQKSAFERAQEEIERMNKLTQPPVSAVANVIASMGGSAALLRAIDENERMTALTNPMTRLQDLVQASNSMQQAWPLFNQFQPEQHADYLSSMQERINANRAKAEALQNSNNEKIEVINERIDQLEAENEMLKEQVKKLIPDSKTSE